MKYVNDMGEKIYSMYKFVGFLVEEVYNGEDTYQDNYSIFDGGIDSFRQLVNDDVKNRNEENGTEYKLTEKQKEKLDKRFFQLKNKFVKNAKGVQDEN